MPGRQHFIHNPIHLSSNISPLVGSHSTEWFGIFASCSQPFLAGAHSGLNICQGLILCHQSNLKYTSPYKIPYYTTIQKMLLSSFFFNLLLKTLENWLRRLETPMILLICYCLLFAKILLRILILAWNFLFCGVFVWF